jgi:hypothetical protein
LFVTPYEKIGFFTLIGSGASPKGWIIEGATPISPSCASSAVRGGGGVAQPSRLRLEFGYFEGARFGDPQELR